MSNKEAVNVLQDMIDYQWGFADFEKPKSIEALKLAIKALENQKTGHWEDTTLANGRKGMKCSNCGCEPIEDSLYGYVYSDYCPNCGVKMEGE